MKVTRLDLGKGKTERKTAGWTDKQIFNQKFETLEAQMDSSKKILETLRDNVRETEDRVRDFERIIRRKKELMEEGYQPT